MPKGKLIVFTAPSGSGKTTLVHYLLSKMSNLVFSVSATTRARRPNEIDGKDYYFLPMDEFREKIANDEFLEWEEVYDGNCYGTLKAEVDHILNLGKHVIFDVDVQGALNIKNYYGDRALSVFVKVPSIKHLEERLTKRNTETAETLEKRLKKATIEIEYATKFDITVLNDSMEKAQKEAYQIVKSFLDQEL